MSGQIIVTISRQPGSGGLEIGRRLSRKFGVAYIDKKTVSHAAEDYENAVCEKGDETRKARFWELLAHTPLLQGFESYVPEIRSIVSDAEVHEKEEELLAGLVGDTSAVIVGRGGFYRFRNHPNAVHIFLCADREYRLTNYTRLFSLSEADADSLLAETERATESYIRRVSGRDLYDARNFDLTLNVAKLDFNCVTELILDLLHDRQEYRENRCARDIKNEPVL